MVAEMGVLFPDSCIGIHLNRAVPIKSAEMLTADEVAGLTAAEQEKVKGAIEHTTRGYGYQQIQRTKPQTLGYGLTDSPSGLLGWIVEKFQAWTPNSYQGDNDLLTCFTKDELITNVMLYWLSGCITSSTRLYYETQGERGLPAA